MHLVLAQMKHETNTFSPVPTDLARFSRGQATPYYGDDAYNAYKGTGSALGGFIDRCEAAGARISVPVAANAWPSGPVHDDAFEHVCKRILDAVAAGCDAVLLDLHGAMVTESLDDGEGELLRRLRALAPGLPVGVALDMHSNLFPAMVEQSTVLAGYQTYPHVDHYETGVRAADPVIALLRGEAAPVMAWGNRPMLPHVMRQSSEDAPNDALQARCREMEAEGALAATLFTGFPHADVSHAGVSAVVVTDGDRALAERMRDELLDSAWASREAFVYRSEPLAESLARAARVSEGPVVLLDHHDNCASGGTMDTTTVLRGILEAGLEDVAVFAIHDPHAVRELVAAGVGSEVTLPVGGRIAMPALGLEGEPLEVAGRVRAITDGRFRNRGPSYAGVLMDMGPSVVLDTGKVAIVLISRHQEPNDLACFTSLGIDPLSKRFLMLKSRVHFRAGFGPHVKDIIHCAGTGVCTSDYSTLSFLKLRRPIFPLDLVNDPAPG